MEISSKLLQGISVDKILDSIRDSGTATIGRQHIINKQDISNIKRKLNIDGIQRHNNDHFSVCAWVQEVEELDYNPVTLFKAQGVDGSSRLSTEDFIIGIQTEFQKDIMEEYGGDIMCMDATHDTNVYDFKLITVLVVDSLGEGVPVAWAISNSEDEIHLTEFLKSIKGRVVELQPQAFMSDDATSTLIYGKQYLGQEIQKITVCMAHR